MSVVEEDRNLQARPRELPLRYAPSLGAADGELRWVYNEGEVRCSRPLPRYASTCHVPSNQTTTLASGSYSFVYLDAGLWGGNQYNFGLVSGPDVYLCEYVPPLRATTPSSIRNTSVRTLFQELNSFPRVEDRCGVRVIKYARAPNTTERTLDDTHLYLFLPDHHLPPITWFYGEDELNERRARAREPVYSYGSPGLPSPVLQELSRRHVYIDSYPPNWLLESSAFRNIQGLTRSRYQGFYSLKRMDDEAGRRRRNSADIFGDEGGCAGAVLVHFLHALTQLSTDIKRRLHVINLGDMFELWLNRQYLFRPGNAGTPHFINGGETRAANRIIEVALFNIEVLEAYRSLENADLAERVQYTWGNHDAYLMDESVTSQCGLLPRYKEYNGLNGDLHAEHGHRFDSRNFDNMTALPALGGFPDGPFWANLAFRLPFIRCLEPLSRDRYLLGPGLFYLSHLFDPNKKPFSIFVMGHTHAREMYMFNIRPQYESPLARGIPPRI